jgi:dolichyl-phosphate-mannose--protein O-mannosyl transferase
MKMPFIVILWKSIVFGVVAVVIMLSCFVIHLIILDYRAADEYFISDAFRQTLVAPRAADFGPRTHGMPLLQRVIELIKIMHTTHMDMTSPHEASSQWWEWPLMLMQSVIYFGERYSVVLHPNPFVWYPAVIGPFIAAVLGVIGYFVGNSDLTALVIWPVGYLSSLLPFALVPRVIFVYHYLVPLIFGIFGFASCMELLMLNVPVARICFFVLWCAVSISFWIFFAPWCYGMCGYDWVIRTWHPWIFFGPFSEGDNGTSPGK